MKKLLLSICLLFPLLLSAQAGDKEPVVEIEPALLPEFPAFYAEAYATGLFPTGANDDFFAPDVSSDTLGGGMAVGYRFHDLAALAVSGQWFYDSGVNIQQYTVDALLFIPHDAGEAAEFDLLPWLSDFIKIPDPSATRLYVLFGGGVQATGSNWDSLLRAGAGIEMPLVGSSKYFIDGTWNVLGLAEPDQPEPYAVFRTGIRINF